MENRRRYRIVLSVDFFFYLLFFVYLLVPVKIQRDITPYRALAHKRYSSMNRVPEHDLMTFFVLHRTKCKPMYFE